MAQEEAAQKKVVGELFSRQYVERQAPLRDNTFFRNRLEAYLQSNHHKDYAEMGAYLKQEAGVVVGTFYSNTYKTIFFNFTEFFANTRIELILTSITLIWRFLCKKYLELKRSKNPLSNPPGSSFFRYPKAEEWQSFVLRAMREENMAYTVDEKCGVHFFVDEEFERNRVTALSCLASPRYEAVRVAFQQAHGYLDAQPPDTKASVRAAFESLEILARLMDSQSKNLNKWMVENRLKSLALARASDSVETTVIERLFDGLALAVDGLHNYRHGQGVQQPAAPSLTVSVYVVSTVAAALRWLVELESNKPVTP